MNAMTETPLAHCSPRESARFWSKVEKTDGCWLWKSGTIISKSQQLYGRFRSGSKMILAHRWTYADQVGVIPEQYTIDHLCRNTLCVRPSHLEAVPRHVNILRGDSAIARQARQTHCKRGHPFDASNTYCRTQANGRIQRTCRACNRLRDSQLRSLETAQQTLATLRIAA